MEFKEKQAIYLQIGEHISETILRKQWEEGEKIPSVREMAMSIEVNPNTVMRTYSYLQDRGIIFNKRGIGYFVADDAYEKTQELKKRNFINRELPHFFKTMDLLKITFDDLKALYITNREIV
ncbi:MAG TPA: GntR family transcriptional regulator [Spirochaetes bacterium]|nr:GntR family transcriptional regulator [Spirochaetota bacterium]